MRLRLPRITDAKDYIITAIILLIAISLMVTRHDGGLHNVQKVSITILSYLEQPLSQIRVYRQALNTNTYLQRQNVLLQDELSRLRSAEQQNRILRELLDFRERSEYPLIPVKIVSKELTGLNNSLTISAGKNMGVEQGMPLISADGLAGIVITSAGQYAQVMPFNNSLYNVSARVQGTRAYGIVSWGGSRHDQLVLLHVPQTIQVQIGEIVETSGYSNQYPPNIPIGEITKIEPEEGKETQIIHLRPFVNLHSVAEGFVVQFNPDTTITNLNQVQRGLF